MLKHVILKKGDRFIGRYAIRVEEDRLQFKTVAGGDLYFFFFEQVLNTADPGILEKARDYNKNKRKYPWRVRERVGYSGCADYWVEYLVNRELGIIKKGGKIHVSMSGKLNQEIDIPIMDIPLICFHLRNYKLDEIPSEYTFEVKDIEIGEFLEGEPEIYEEFESKGLTYDSYITPFLYKKLTGACEEGIEKFIDMFLPEYKEKRKIKIKDLLPVLERYGSSGAEKIKEFLNINEEGGSDEQTSNVS